jgi:hypothetical protein
VIPNNSPHISQIDPSHSLTHSLTYWYDEKSRVNQSDLRGYGLLCKCSRSVKVDLDIWLLVQLLVLSL